MTGRFSFAFSGKSDVKIDDDVELSLAAERGGAAIDHPAVAAHADDLAGLRDGRIVRNGAPVEEDESAPEQAERLLPRDRKNLCDDRVDPLADRLDADRPRSVERPLRQCLDRRADDGGAAHLAEIFGDMRRDLRGAEEIGPLLAQDEERRP